MSESRMSTAGLHTNVRSFFCMAERVDRVGQQIGDYRLIRKVSSGSFGSVYLGEHTVRDALHVSYHSGLVSFLEELYEWRKN